MTPQRLITHRQEQIYRMRHQDFVGLTTKQVAAMLGITTHSVARHMWEMQKIAPQLFPILTRRQADIYHMFTELGLEQKVIAEVLGISSNCVAIQIYRLRNKGMYVPRRLHQVLYMPRAHDHLIKRKF